MSEKNPVGMDVLLANVDVWLNLYGGEWLDGSGFEDEPENAPECSDDYDRGCKACGTINVKSPMD